MNKLKCVQAYLSIKNPVYRYFFKMFIEHLTKNNLLDDYWNGVNYEPHDFAYIGPMNYIEAFQLSSSKQGLFYWITKEQRWREKLIDLIVPFFNNTEFLYHIDKTIFFNIKKLDNSK